MRLRLRGRHLSQPRHRAAARLPFSRRGGERRHIDLQLLHEPAAAQAQFAPLYQCRDTTARHGAHGRCGRDDKPFAFGCVHHGGSQRMLAAGLHRSAGR